MERERRDESLFPERGVGNRGRIRLVNDDRLFVVIGANLVFFGHGIDAVFAAQRPR